VNGLRIELTDSDGCAAGSLSDSTVHELSTFLSLSAVRGRVPRLQVAALRVDTRQAFLGVRPSWDVRGHAVRTDGDCVPAVVFDSLKGR
jgi:hypothetical protein